MLCSSYSKFCVLFVLLKICFLRMDKTILKKLRGYKAQDLKFNIYSDTMDTGSY